MAKKELTREAILAQIKTEKTKYTKALKSIQKQQDALYNKQLTLNDTHSQRLKDLNTQLNQLQESASGSVIVRLVLGTAIRDIYIQTTKTPFHVYGANRCWQYEWKEQTYEHWAISTQYRAYNIQHSNNDDGQLKFLDSFSNIYTRNNFCRNINFFLSEGDGQQLINLLHQIIAFDDVTKPLNFKAIMPILQKGYGLDLSHYKMQAKDWNSVIKFLNSPCIRNDKRWAQNGWELTDWRESTMESCQSEAEEYVSTILGTID